MLNYCILAFNLRTREEEGVCWSDRVSFGILRGCLSMESGLYKLPK